MCSPTVNTRMIVNLCFHSTAVVVPLLRLLYLYIIINILCILVGLCSGRIHCIEVDMGKMAGEEGPKGS